MPSSKGVITPSTSSAASAGGISPRSAGVSTRSLGAVDGALALGVAGGALALEVVAGIETARVTLGVPSLATT